jgi:hypothetical protein
MSELIEIAILILKLTVFGIVLYGNAHWILAFNRWCQYDTYTEETYYETRDGFTEMPAGSIIPETKMILWRVKKWCDKNLSVFMSKPVYSCPTCMASVHGVLPFWITYLTLCDFSFIAIPLWLFYTGVLSGYTTIINER